MIKNKVDFKKVLSGLFLERLNSTQIIGIFAQLEKMEVRWPKSEQGGFLIAISTYLRPFKKTFKEMKPEDLARFFGPYFFSNLNSILENKEKTIGWQPEARRDFNASLVECASALSNLAQSAEQSMNSLKLLRSKYADNRILPLRNENIITTLSAVITSSRLEQGHLEKLKIESQSGPISKDIFNLGCLSLIQSFEHLLQGKKIDICPLSSNVFEKNSIQLPTATPTRLLANSLYLAGYRLKEQHSSSNSKVSVSIEGNLRKTLPGSILEAVHEANTKQQREFRRVNSPDLIITLKTTPHVEDRKSNRHKKSRRK